MEEKWYWKHPWIVVNANSYKLMSEHPTKEEASLHAKELCLKDPGVDFAVFQAKVDVVLRNEPVIFNEIKEK